MARQKRPDGFPKVTLRNLSRPEPKYFGWRVYIKRHGAHHVKYFPDGPDGPFDSLRAALRWRDRMWLRLGAPSHVPARQSRNTSGIIGVRREIQRTASGSISEQWVAKWIDADRKRHSRAFSVDKYGDDEAKRLATAARKAGIAATKQERARRLSEILYTHSRMVGRDPRPD